MCLFFIIIDEMPGNFVCFNTNGESVIQPISQSLIHSLLSQAFRAVEAAVSTTGMMLVDGST